MNFEKCCKMALILFYIMWGVGIIDFLKDLWKTTQLQKKELPVRGLVLIFIGYFGIVVTSLVLG